MPDASRRRALHTLPAAAVAACLVSACSSKPAWRPAEGSSRIGAWRQARRGFNIGAIDAARHDEAFFADVGEHGSRLVRASIPWSLLGAEPGPTAAARRALDRVLPRIERAGLEVVLVPELDAEPSAPLWRGPPAADAFAAGWAALARDLRRAEVVAGFDLLNEPNPPWTDGRVASSAAIWDRVAREAVSAIIAEDPGVPLVLEGVAGGNAMGLAAMPAWNTTGLIYSLHLYAPHEITHQGVSARWPRAVRYPMTDAEPLRGVAPDPGPWNLQRLAAELQPVVDRAATTGRPVFVGEFSCVRWAPEGSAERYVSDCLSLFESFGWSWAYHEFRGWPGWDAEIASSERTVTRRSADAPLMRRLRHAMQRPPSS